MFLFIVYLIKKLIAFLFDNYDKEYIYKCLFLACKQNDIKLLRYIVKNNRDIDLNKTDIHDNTLIHIACRNRNLDMIKEILSHTNTNTTYKMYMINLNIYNKNHNTPLLQAYHECNNEITLFFLGKEIKEKYNIDINCKDKYGNTLLHSLCNLERCYNTVDELSDALLLHKDCDVNMLNSSELTPFYMSCIQNNHIMCKKLISISDINYKNAFNNNVLQQMYALSVYNREIIELIVKRNDFDINNTNILGYTIIYDVCHGYNIIDYDNQSRSKYNIKYLKLILTHPNIDIDINIDIDKFD